MYKSMIRIAFEPIPNTLTEVVEYLEYLDVLGANKKKLDAQKRAIVS